MRLSHQNRPCPCTCADILVQAIHENRRNHDGRPVRRPVLGPWLELDLPTAASLPSTTNVEFRSIRSGTLRVADTTIHRNDRRASRAKFCDARDRPSQFCQYFIFRPDSNSLLPIIHQRGWVWSFNAQKWVFIVFSTFIVTLFCPNPPNLPPRQQFWSRNFRYCAKSFTPPPATMKTSCCCGCGRKKWVFNVLRLFLLPFIMQN